MTSSTKHSARLNLTVNPVGVLFGILGVEAQYGLSQSVTINSGVAWLRSENIRRTSDMFEYRLGTSIYLDSSRFKTGWILEPGILVNRLDEDPPSILTQGLPPYQYYFTTSAGRIWVFPSGFNVEAGAGLALGLNSSARVAQPLLRVQVGWVL